MQTCLLGRVFNSGGAVALGIFKPRGGFEKRERERREKRGNID